MLLTLLLPFILEIQSMTVSWNTHNCGQACQNHLSNELANLPFLKESTVNGDQGNVILRWKPNMPLNFPQVQRVFNQVGFASKSFEIKVSGSISSQGKNFFLTSTGDRTKFLLVGPTPIKEGQMVIRPSTSPLEGELLVHIEEAKKTKTEVLITGELFTSPTRISVRKVSLQ